MTVKSGRPCTICEFTGPGGVAVINRALKTGQSVKALAKRFGVPESNLRRHKLKHLDAPDRASEVPERAAQPRPASAAIAADPTERPSITIRTPQDVLNVVEVQVQHYDRLSYRLEREGDINGALKGRRNLVDAVERIFAKVHGLISDQPVVNIDARQLHVQQAVAGAPEAGLRGLLRVISAVGEEKVEALVAVIEQLGVEEIQYIVDELAAPALPSSAPELG